VAGSLKIPAGVALVGSNQAPVYIEPLIGTVILATGGRDKEDAPALFEMGDSSTVQGLTVFYPEQKPDDIHFSSGRPKNPGKALVEADGGKLQVQGCSFATPEPSILLSKGLKHAIVTGNNGVTGVTITNQIGDKAIIANNEPGGEKQ
jgi:hypothetical protein